MLEPAMLRPATEAVLQTAPRAALSADAAARVQRKGPSRLVARIVAQNSSVSRSSSGGGIGATVAEVPALLARKSSRPSAAIASPTIFSAAGAFDTSPGAPITASPSAPRPSTPPGPRGTCGQELRTTWAPRRANSSTVASPMPEAAPVTNAVLPSRSLMPTRLCKKVSPGRYRAKRLRAARRRSPAHFGKENAALRLGGRLRFHDFHHHRFGRNGEVLHHRIGDVLDQRALLIERAALDGVHVNFRHIGLPLCASHRGTIPTA